MKKVNQIVTILLCVFFLAFVPSHALAMDTNNEETYSVNVTSGLSDEELLQEHLNQMKEYCKQIGIDEDVTFCSSDDSKDLPQRNDPSDYKTTYSSPINKVFPGYAGNQPSGGTRFSTGGGFYYSASGGPNKTLTVAFGGDFGNISVTVPLGKKASTGYFVEAPDRINYYKLYVKKTYQVRAYTIYHKEWNDVTMSYYWRKVSTNHSKVFISQDLSAKKV